jgi:hypothetical protein
MAETEAMAPISKRMRTITRIVLSILVHSFD